MTIELKRTSSDEVKLVDYRPGKMSVVFLGPFKYSYALSEDTLVVNDITPQPPDDCVDPAKIKRFTGEEINRQGLFSRDGEVIIWRPTENNDYED